LSSCYFTRICFNFNQ